LESDTHTKIIIRGRGSSRDGKGSLDGIGRDEPLHVIITGDREEDVQAAERRIREILVVKDDAKNPFKQAQMRELAIINGQVANGVFCAICGERGHNQYNCPNKPRNQ
jgi:singapore isolate B (sub-type 7) whole genome shotgun sequence assembly, scaffold_0